MSKQLFRTTHRKKLLHLGPILIFLASFFLIANFFEYFPNGWDQTEYARGLKQNYLPHSPYILFFLLGKLFYWLINDAAVALSTLSFASGLLSLALFYRIASQFLGDSSGLVRWGTAVITPLLLGTNYLFVRQAGTQEIYIVQLCFLLLTVALILSRKPKRAVWAGLAYGGAIAIHNASFFLLPAILFLLVAAPGCGKSGWGRRILPFLGTAVATVLLFSALIYLLFPKNYPNHLAFYFDYLRGIAPAIRLGRLFDWPFLQQSAQGLLFRLTAPSIAHGRMPLATFPVGLSSPHLLLALVGLGVLGRINWRAAVFWLLWSLPYLCYEILLGNTPDFGVYIVFLLPMIAIGLGTLLAWTAVQIHHRNGRRLAVTALVTIITFALLWLPSLRQFQQRWHDVAQDAVAQYADFRLAALALVDALPEDAVVIQSSEEWNVNALPFYMPYRPVVRDGGYLLLYNGLGAFTPMTYAYYQVLTTERLTALLAADVPVYAFEPDPLQNFDKEMIDREAFEWQEALTVDLAAVQDQLLLPPDLRPQLPDGRFTLYQATLAAQP